SEPVSDKKVEQGAQEEKTYIAVPYKERNDAKKLGAKWDAAAKSWYVSADTPRESIAKWLPENIRAEDEQLPAMTPTSEFKEALESLGCVVDGAHPIIDGKTHRITTDGDKRGEQSGFYVAHLDGHPAGYIKNNRTGEELKWKAKGYVLSPQEKAKLQAEAAEKLKQRELDTLETQNKAADRVKKQQEKLTVPNEPTAYMKDKGIGIHEGVYTDSDKVKTYVPAYDAQGKQWTMQYINDHGVKRFAKNSKKEGCFHVVGGMKALDQAQTLIIVEGYATAASIAETMKLPVVAAFDSGNLVHVAESLREKFPDKPIVIAGDDDKDQEIKKKINPGKQKAEEAASLVNGVAVFPVFAPGEQTDNPKSFSDFNDLATKSKLGAAAVKRQLKAVIDSQRTVEKTKSKVIQLNQDKNDMPKKKAARI
ncbi:MAG: toprim domain-containing protein, partial [Verrucomicrobiae bacterium]|nr:toprim domain-containing protein [Verrucomicrobiae bacterium]